MNKSSGGNLGTITFTHRRLHGVQYKILTGVNANIKPILNLNKKESGVFVGLGKDFLSAISFCEDVEKFLPISSVMLNFSTVNVALFCIDKSLNKYSSFGFSAESIVNIRNTHSSNITSHFMGITFIVHVIRKVLDNAVLK